ncbi:PaaI family thioesterase [Taibaiella koreensis]|uniref:PaaI family thioesterase n=1 Tax=Taibaiella koreensis TaxID=1268548 RepID=UPI000E59DFD1|nr:PaaI family thioesterase [Taibaiella koreensis]
MIAKALEVIQGMIGMEIDQSRSPAGNWLRPRLEAAERGKVKLSVLIRREMCNPFGNIHGGMMSLIVDECIGWAIVSLEAPSHYTSVSLNLDFLYAAAEGERITAEAEIVRHGKKIIHATVQVINEKGILLCKASSNLVATGMKIKEPS